jgi:hypothetical protein
MKYLLIAILLGACLFSIHARTLPESEQAINKRFLSSIGSWFNNNIIDPINNHVINPAINGINTAINVSIDGINTGVNVISDPFISFGNQFMNVIGQVDNFFTNTLVNAVNSAYDSVKDKTLDIVNMAQNVIFPSGNNAPASIQDPCDTTCIFLNSSLLKFLAQI